MVGAFMTDRDKTPPAWGDPKITPPEHREPDRKVEFNRSVERYRKLMEEQKKEPLPF